MWWRCVLPTVVRSTVHRLTHGNRAANIARRITFRHARPHLQTQHSPLKHIAKSLQHKTLSIVVAYHSEHYISQHQRCCNVIRSWAITRHFTPTITASRYLDANNVVMDENESSIQTDSVSNTHHPSLGDFSSLRESLISFQPQHNILSNQWQGDDNVKLGNLSKIVTQLRKGGISGSSSREPSPKPSSELASAISRIPHRGQSISPAEKSTHLPPEKSNDETLHPPGSSAKSSSPRSTGKRSPAKQSPITNARDYSRFGQILSYQQDRNGPLAFVFGTLHTTQEAKFRLSQKLVPRNKRDAVLRKQHPKVTSNGVHVFLDMSNIDISFHKCLRIRHQLPHDSKFNPTPRLNLEFLTDILLRGRQADRMFASCSILPGRSTEPRFVQDLRNLGYSTDVRTRKRVEEIDHASPSVTGAIGIRYVEDLVDETLQTRMAESAMSCFQNPGIMVLATGDAKPAQYSDGFFAYVERALQMGWNVEVVSWRNSLSASWRAAQWKGQWGDRFSIIELDEFVDELLDCYVTQ